jgi:hypothetical protein
MKESLSLEAQVEMVQASGLDALVCCPDAWALRHEFTNVQTGETIPARCGSWDCPYCGPRKVDMWRQLIKMAEPGLHVVLTKVGKTLKVRRIHNQKAIGYVTKYLMKQIDRERRGLVQETRKVKVAAWQPVAGSEDAQGEPIEYGVCLDEQGQVVEQERVEVIERMCKARRIRYSRRFFPATTAVLRQRLFGKAEQQAEDETTEAEEAESIGGDLQAESTEESGASENGTPEENQRQAMKRSEWVLREAAPFSEDITVYRLRRRKVVRRALEKLREGKRLFSRRVITIWSYQREQLRLAG